ncbi:MAG: XRE family transcriptional regulator [Desulfobulbaceae bacterium]|nr:MAG: XRE family transcriptional regulator [Desulfobulbaceae bacterium]
MQERAALLTALQEHLGSLPGTQADKADALGITQPRLNDLLKERIDKFSLDALVSIANQAGLRVNLNIHPIQLHSGFGSIPPTRNIELSVFAPAPSELSNLNATSSTTVFRNLLICEALAIGLNPKDVIVSSNITAKDGGIDAKVENSPESGALLATGSNHFQIKSGPSFKPWQPSSLKKELFGKSSAKPSKKLLGSEVINCLDQNGTYSIVTFGHDLHPNQHTQAIQELSKLLIACGYPNPQINVYGQGQIVGELDKYPSLCLSLIGLDEGGFLSFSGWRDNSQMQLPLHLGEEQKSFIDEIRSTIQQSSYQHIRIIGEPGIGKTRLVFESISREDIAPSVIYVPTGEDFQKSRLFNELLKSDKSYSATLIIDDCDNRDRTSIWSTLKGRKGLKLITIDHGPEETYDSAMKTFICPQLMDEQIKGILSEYISNTSELSNWASWCGGSPRVAHAVGENLKSNPENILKSPADVPIWDRYIIGHKVTDSVEAEQHRIVLRYIALFQKFGFESPVHEEGQFISSLIQETDQTITWGKFQSVVQYYRKKRILQGRHTLFIVPKALHIHLWLEFWDKHGRGLDFLNFLSRTPGTMRRWLLQLFIYAHQAEPAQRMVKDILSPDGPFQDEEFLKSEVGLRFINYLSEADPASTLSLLERTIKNWPYEELLKWHSGRQDIVWALEKIAVWDNLFNRAVNVLIPMALAENASNSNNSKGLLQNLFQVGLGWAPTQATPQKRFLILKNLIQSRVDKLQALGIELCEQWLSTHGGIRMVGAEHQGLKPAIQFWYPKTYGELFNAWREVLHLLRAELQGFNVSARNQVARVVINSAGGIIQYKDMSDEVIEMLFDFAKDPEISNKPLTQFVISRRWHSNDKLPQKIIKKIDQLDQLITGKSFKEKFNRFVLHTNWDEDYTFRGEDYIEFDFPAKRVEELAKMFMSDIDLFSKHIATVIREDGHRLTQFGNECGKITTNQFNEILFSHFETIADDFNGNFISGYMKGLRSHDEATWHTQLMNFLTSDKTRRIAIECIWQSGFTKEILKKMLSLLKNNNIPPRYFNRFTLRSHKDEVPENLFQEILSELLSHQDDSSIGICTELAQNYYFDKDSPKTHPEELIFDILSAVPPEKKQDQMYGYYWKIIAVKFLEKHPSRGINLLEHILGHMDKISRFGNSSYILQVADQIVIADPKGSWEKISEHLSIDSIKRHGIIHWLGESGFEDKPKKGPINYLPQEKLIEWTKDDPKERLWIIKELLPKTLDKDNGGLLTTAFIEEFCSDDDTARSLFWHFWTGGWSGPESQYLERKRDSARKWLTQTSSLNVQLWLEKYIDHLSSRIEKAQIDEEREF